MMVNSTQVSYFRLGAYFDTGMLKYLYFTIILCLYILIIISNVMLIVVIRVNRSLHEPMYLFLCSLFVNELLGSTGLFPFLLVQILKDTHNVSVSLCFLQIFCVYTYADAEFFILAVVSYDRYLAICHPLQYHTCMSHRRVVVLNVFTWLWTFLLVIILISLSSSLPRCGNIIHKVYCDNFSIVKLACSDITAVNIHALIHLSIVVLVPVMLILYTYMRILKVCFSGSKQTRHKAVSTCTPHLASLVNFACACCFESIQNRFNMNHLPNILRIVLSLYFLTCQPLFNPVVYGLKMSKILIACRNLVKKNILDTES